MSTAESSTEEWVPGSGVVHPTGGYDDVRCTPEFEIFLLAGQVHRLDGPAEVHYQVDAVDGTRVRISEEWVVGGHYHRLDGPASRRFTPWGPVPIYEAWYVDGYYHRTDGPAMVSYYPDGAVREETYFRRGREHREDGPAVISYLSAHDSEVTRTMYALDGHRFPDAETTDRYREARLCGAPEEWALAYATGQAT